MYWVQVEVRKCILKILSGALMVKQKCLVKSDFEKQLDYWIHLKLCKHFVKKKCQVHVREICYDRVYLLCLPFAHLIKPHFPRNLTLKNSPIEVLGDQDKL